MYHLQFNETFGDSVILDMSALCKVSAHLLLGSMFVCSILSCFCARLSPSRTKAFGTYLSTAAIEPMHNTFQTEFQQANKQTVSSTIANLEGRPTPGVLTSSSASPRISGKSRMCLQLAFSRPAVLL